MYRCFSKPPRHVSRSALNTLGIMYNSIGKDYFAQAVACFAAACEEGMIEQEPAAVYAKYLREGLGGVAVDKKKRRGGGEDGT